MDKQIQDAADYIYAVWDKTLSSNDLDGVVALYAEDAVLESPLIPYLMHQEGGWRGVNVMCYSYHSSVFTSIKRNFYENFNHGCDRLNW